MKEKFIVKERKKQWNVFCFLLLDVHSVFFFLIWILKKFANNLFCIRKRTFLKKETNTKLWCFLFCLNHCRALYIRQKPIILESTTQKTIIHGIKISNFMLNLERKKEIAKINKFIDENRKQNRGNRKSVVWNNEKK